MPKTSLGKWSVGLIVVFFLSIGAMVILVALGQRRGDTFFSNPWLAVSGITAAASGSSALAAGLVSIIRDKERSFLVLLAVAIGFLVTFFWLGEVLYPH